MQIMTTPRGCKSKMQKSTRQRLKERQDASLVLASSEESFNSMSLENIRKTDDGPKPFSHGGSGYNSGNRASMSGRVFVLGADGKPLTPCKNSKARKLMKGKQARPVWNKFGGFGIQMLVTTREEIPKSALGVDFGTKFEGYAVTVGKENNLAVMWKLPDKKKLVKKLEERRRLRRARRFRNCRRRVCKSDNRGRKGFIAPSQKVIVQSRLKCLNEFFKCYPIDTVAMEDVCFNHRDNKWGKNFSTVEIGKKMINDWIRQRSNLTFFKGFDTESCREKYGYKKSGIKSAEIFNSHCSDALAIAADVYAKRHIIPDCFIIADDSYRCVRRRLHDSQFSKGHIRYPYSTGNFKGIKKGAICEYGQIVGGTGNQLNILPIEKREESEKRISKSISKVGWLSHNFKTKEVRNSPQA